MFKMHLELVLTCWAASLSIKNQGFDEFGGSVWKSMMTIRVDLLYRTTKVTTATHQIDSVVPNLAVIAPPKKESPSLWLTFDSNFVGVAPLIIFESGTEGTNSSNINQESIIKYQVFFSEV